MKPPSRRRLAATLAALSGVLGFGIPSAKGASSAEQPYVHHGFAYRSTTAARYNPLGLSTFFRFGYQRPLLGPQENILLQRTYVGVYGVTTLTPAFIRGGLRLDVQPLAFLQILVAYEGMGLFGTFDTLQSFGRVSEDFSDARQSERSSVGLAYSTTGALFTFEPIFQAKLGPITLVSDTSFIHSDMSVTPGDRFYYDLPLGLLALEEGWMVSNETDLAYNTSFGLSVGVRHGVYHAFYRGAAIAGEEARAREITPIEFAGPLFGYTFFDENRALRFNAPSVFLNVSFWIRNPYRTGEEISRAVPYIVTGFTFRGDL